MPQPSPEFEKSFADLSYSYINQNAPKLLDFMVGFQVLEHEDDESRAVGVLGFSVGGRKKDMFYAPVFFLNGKLKGQELLYNGTSDLFMPMDEAWVDFILNKKPEMIGSSAEDDDRGSLTRYTPNFKDLLGRGMSKAATEMDVMGATGINGTTVLGEAFDITPALKMFTADHKQDLYKAAAESLDLEKLVGESDSLLHALEVRLTQYDDFAKYASAFHTFDSLVTEDVKEEQVTEVVKEASEHKVGDVVFLTDSNLCYTDAQKEEFVKHSFVVVDERAAEDKSGVIEGEISATTPSEPGIYSLVLDDLSVKRFLYLPASETSTGLEDPGVTRSYGACIVDVESGVKYTTCGNPISLLSTPDIKLEDVKESDVKGLTSIKTKRKDSNLNKSVRIVNMDTGVNKELYGVNKIIQSPKIKEITTTGSSTLVVPEGRCKMMTTTYNHGKSRELLITAVGVSRVFDSVFTISKTRDKVVLKTPETSKEASTRLEAMKTLMVGQGLSKSAAEHVLDSATEDGYDYVVKSAAPYDERYDPYVPMMDIDDSAGSDPYTGALVTESTERSFPVQGQLINNRSDYGEMEPDVFETMRRSVSTKQKEVFDLTALNSLTDVGDVNEAIDKNLPGIVTAVDKIGRSLFLLYFHMEDFQERYGKEELSGLEDTLKSALKTNGKLVLFLKKRSISQDIDDVEVEL